MLLASDDKLEPMTYLMNNLSRFFMKLKCEEKKSSKILLTPTHA